MQTRNTLIMAGVLVAISVFVYFYEIQGRDVREEAERLEGLLVVLDAADVTGLTLTNGSGTVEAVKSDATWRIVAPVETAADDIALEAIVEAIAGAERQRLVVEGAEDLAPFGLAEPFATVVFARGDAPPVRVSAGKETPVGGSAYAAIDDSGDVYSALLALRTSLDKSLFDLRDRSVMNFNSGDINRVELRRNGLNAVLNRSDSGWIADAPFSGSADAQSVNSLLSTLTSADAAAFVTDTADEAALAAHGLDAPRLTATLRSADDASHELIVGNEATEPAGYYAMRTGGTAIFVIESALLDEIPASAAALRDRQVLHVDRQQLAEITIERAGEPTLQLRRDGVEWSITQPQVLDADDTAMSRLLSGITELRAEDFAAAGNASTATLRLGLRAPGSDNTAPAEILSVAIGDRSSATPSDDAEAEAIAVLAVTPDGSDTAFLVPATDLDGVLVDLFAIRAKTLVEFVPEELQSLVVSSVDTTHTFTRSGEEWTVDTGDLGDIDVADVLWDLNYLNMDGVAHEWTGAMPDLTAYGLQAPRYRVVASDANGVVADVQIGAETAAEGATQVYALVDDQSSVYEIGTALADVLAALLENLEG
jgi:hypothetical protein